MPPKESVCGDCGWKGVRLLTHIMFGCPGPVTCRFCGDVRSAEKMRYHYLAFHYEFAWVTYDEEQ